MCVCVCVCVCVRAPSSGVAHRLSSCGRWVLVALLLWDLPGPGVEPVSPALQADSLLLSTGWLK